MTTGTLDEDAQQALLAIIDEADAAPYPPPRFYLKRVLKTVIQTAEEDEEAVSEGCILLYSSLVSQPIKVIS